MTGASIWRYYFVSAGENLHGMNRIYIGTVGDYGVIEYLCPGVYRQREADCPAAVTATTTATTVQTVPSAVTTKPTAKPTTVPTPYPTTPKPSPSPLLLAIGSTRDCRGSGLHHRMRRNRNLDSLN